MNSESGEWRLAERGDDGEVVEMSLALYAEDPASRPVSEAQVRLTLEAFRAQPARGRAVVLEADGRLAGYAFLVSFWSNELGGEICTIDELYVRSAWRGRGLASRLVEALEPEGHLWPGRPVALELEVSPGNVRALALYERLGFHVKRNRTLRRVGSGPLAFDEVPPV